MKYYHVDDKRNATTGKWIVRRPDDLRFCFADTRADALAIAAAMNDRDELRILLAWTGGTLAESQAMAMLGCTALELKRRRDTCLREMGKH